MSILDPLYEELDQWNFEGREAMFWWRDDDVEEPTDALQQMLDLSRQYDAPVTLAAIPENLDQRLGSVLQDFQIVQHGFGHHNHAPASGKKQELGNHRAPEAVMVELIAGMNKLKDVFGDNFLPVLVPPWNRISDDMVARLPNGKFFGLSCYGNRQIAEPAADVWLINTHVDIIDWKNGKKFVGEDASVKSIISHLSARRLGQVDRAEPVGLLTHHLVHDNACWDFLEALFVAMDQHPAVTWLGADRVFQTRWRGPHDESGEKDINRSGYLMPAEYQATSD